MPLPPTYKFRSIPALIGLYTKFGSDPPHTILQGQLYRTMSLSISKPFTTPSAPIPPLAGFRLQVLRLNLPLPPLDYRIPYLCVFIQLFPHVLCLFFGEGLNQGMTWREIGENLGFSKKQMKQFNTRKTRRGNRSPRKGTP